MNLPNYRVDAQVTITINGWQQIWSTDNCVIEGCLLETDAKDIGYALEQSLPYGVPQEPYYRLTLKLRRTGLPERTR